MKLKALALASVLAGLGVTGATAATVNWGATDETPTMDVATNLGTPDGVSFTWTKAPSSGWIEFTTETAFALKLHFYGVGDDTPLSQQVTGFVFKAWDAVSNSWTNLTTDTSICSTSALAPIAGDCSLIGSKLYNGPESVLKMGEQFGRFGPGRYLIGVYDNREPSDTSAQFQLAAVPLPATGLALLAGLGGLAAIGARRRRAAA